MNNAKSYTGLEIAIIGISSRVSGSSNWRGFWQNLMDEKESLVFLSDQEVLDSGVEEALIKDPNYIKCSSDLKGKDLFDSNFFDYTPDEGRFMNPQNRIFHECAWEALEDAGYDPERTNGRIGLYAAAFDDFYWRIYSSILNKNETIPEFTLVSLNNKDTMTTQVSYKLGLNGPSLSVQSACSSALAAVHLACKGLLMGESKMALAGGVRISSGKAKGYLYKDGSVYSKDGHCRAFDKDASGTIGGEGAGVVLLKRLKDAIEDRDNIYAVIKGSAVNNDGSRKVGFNAPSVDGQVECIKMALNFSKVESNTIGYIEAHGTGTRLGDPIEIEALNIAFNRNKEISCPVGSVKTNIGHLDAAAGIVGLIKTALSLKFKKIPASLNFYEPNPEIDFKGGPFYINTKLKEWERKGDLPLRAGVNSFGVGGSNAHVILEEAPEKNGSENNKQYELLILSAKTENAVIRYESILKEFLLKDTSVNLSDMSYTLQVGRKQFGYRKAIVFSNREELIKLLDVDIAKKQIVKAKERNNAIVFMFPGQGAQYLNMGRDLYENNILFRDHMNNGFSIIEKLTGTDYKCILFSENAGKSIYETIYAQPIIFLFEYSLAKLIMSYGVIPSCLIGHSLGEYVAACISGLFNFEDALTLIIQRGRLMHSVPEGSMLSVPITADEAQQYVTDNIALAAVNGQTQIVFSGDPVSIDRLIEVLNQKDIPSVRLYTSIAAHSSMLDGILAEYGNEVKKIAFNTMQYPFVSNVTGELITQEMASSPEYWVTHMRNTVMFSKGIENIINQNKEILCLEVGPGHSLSSLLKQEQTDKIKPVAINLIRSIKENENDQKYLLDRIGQLWKLGGNVNWIELYKNEKRSRISLPTYSFESIKYTTEVNAFAMLSENGLRKFNTSTSKINDWFYRIQWKQSLWLTETISKEFENKSVLIFGGENEWNNRFKKYFEAHQINYVLVLNGQQYEKKNDGLYTINPFEQQSFESLFASLKLNNFIPSHIIHMWNYESVDFKNNYHPGKNTYYQKVGYESILNIVRKFDAYYPAFDLKFNIIGNGWYNITGQEVLIPIKSTTLGAVKSIPLEFRNISCKSIDILEDSDNSFNSVLKELATSFDTNEIAIRGKHRYVKSFEKIDFELQDDYSVLRKKGTYVITGANGGMGNTFAQFLAKEYQANLILISRGNQQVALIENLKKSGSDVIYIQSDISDEKNIVDKLTDAEKIFGNINGVIHTAGLGDYAGIILRRTHEDDEKIFASKIYGTQILTTYFENKQLDFFVNCSSNAASVAPFGQVGYVAANIFKDTIAESSNALYPVVSIEWTTMQETGMALKATEHMSPVEQDAILKDGITPAEAIKVLLNALYLKVPVQIISVKDFNEIAFMQETFTKSTDVEFDNTQLNERERPELSSPYVEAITDTEKKLVIIVQNLLGINRIGIEDIFFELGGDSLKGLVLLKRIKNELGIELTLKQFYDNQTIKQMALTIDEIKTIVKREKTTFKTII